MTATDKTTSRSEGEPKPAAPSISLPKGGGAIRGIGEKFAANPVTGTGSMTVPIATSPGRSGFGPQLSLSYDSGAGNGPFGFGWSLSLPSITRKTDKGLPQYDDAEESDVFILSGAEDLVPVLEPDGTRAREDCHATVARLDYRSAATARASKGCSPASSAGPRPRRRRCPLALDLQGQHPHALRPGRRARASPTPHDAAPHLQLADLRDPRRQGQRRSLRLQAGGRRRRRSRPTRTSATAGDRDDVRRTANRYLKRIRYGNRASAAGQRRRIGRGS